MDSGIQLIDRLLFLTRSSRTAVILINHVLRARSRSAGCRSASRRDSSAQTGRARQYSRPFSSGARRRRALSASLTERSRPRASPPHISPLEFDQLDERQGHGFPCRPGASSSPKAGAIVNDSCTVRQSYIVIAGDINMRSLIRCISLARNQREAHSFLYSSCFYRGKTSIIFIVLVPRTLSQQRPRQE